MNWLMTNSLTVVAKGIFKHIDIFSAKNINSFVNTLATRVNRYTHLFQQKISVYLPYFKIEILTSHLLMTVLSFEQLGPDLCFCALQIKNWHQMKTLERQ